MPVASKPATRFLAVVMLGWLAKTLVSRRSAQPDAVTELRDRAPEDDEPLTPGEEEAIAELRDRAPEDDEPLTSEEEAAIE